MLIFRVENIQRVCGGEGKDVVSWVPGNVKHFVTEVKNVNRNLVFLSFVAVADTAWFQWLFVFRGVTRCLKCDISLRLTIKQSEMVVVRTGQQHSVTHKHTHTDRQTDRKIVRNSC